MHQQADTAGGDQELPLPQVYAISGKASDVRGVVTKLNEKRQKAEEAHDQALINAQDEDDDDLDHHEERQDHAGPARAVTWQNYLDQACTRLPTGFDLL